LPFIEKNTPANLEASSLPKAKIPGLKTLSHTICLENMHLSRQYADYLQPTEQGTPSGTSETNPEGSSSRPGLSLPQREELIRLASLNQLLAGLCGCILYLPAVWSAIPWWGILSIIAGLVLVLYLSAGIGKWEVPVIASLALIPGGNDLHLPFVAVAFLATMLFSVILFFRSTRGDEEFGRVGKILFGVMAPLVLMESLLIVFGTLGVGWFLLAWATSPNFG
jgi:hypothetical protein